MADDHTQYDQEAKQTILENIEKLGCHLALLEPNNWDGEPGEIRKRMIGNMKPTPPTNWNNFFKTEK